jgi:hypothetical protein
VIFASPDEALLGVARLIAVALLLQTIELWQLRRAAADDGVWSWPILRRDLDGAPSPLRRLLDALLSYRGLRALLAGRLAAAAALFFVPHVVLVALLLASTVLLALRWRGSVNGGSDFMTIVVLSALTVATAFPDRPLVVAGSLCYIALQSANSYFIAGLAKLKAASWRRGTALPAFLASAVLDGTALRRLLVRSPLRARAASWFVIALECSVPLALLHPTLCAIVTALLVAFHIANVYVFGLNRFLWAWAATYPAIFYCSYFVQAWRGAS